MSFPGFDHIYLLSESDSVFRISMDISVEESFALTRGELHPRHAVTARWVMGRRRPGDFVWATSAAPVVVSGNLGTVVASLALMLAAVGLFGVMAYTVNQRTREVGIRMALGASASRVMGWVFWQSSGIVGVGILLGLIVSATFSRALSTFLFGLSPWDPTAFVGCAIVLSGIALVATYVPARRAMRVDLTTALRQE